MRILTSRDVFFFSDDRRRAEYDLRLRDSTSSYTRTSSGWASSSATYGYGYGYGHGRGSWRRTPPGSRAGASGIATESLSVLLPQWRSYPAILASKHVYIRILYIKKEKNTHLLRT
jgi:hypothetical protein